MKDIKQIAKEKYPDPDGGFWTETQKYHVEKLREAFISGSQYGKEWISVETELPDEKVYVLLYHPLRDLYKIGYLFNQKWCSQTMDILSLTNFTHWMPLPEPPIKIDYEEKI